MNIKTNWNEIPRGFYLEREFHPELNKGSYVLRLCLRANDGPRCDQPRVPAYGDSYKALSVNESFWEWAKQSLPVLDVDPTCTFTGK